MNAEFRMITNVAAAAPSELKFNYDELKAALTEGLENYRKMVVTADAISDAKADKARLNRLAKSIDEYRISVKKQLMEKYDTDFKPKCDELTGLIKEASDNIGRQVKAFEDAEAAAKIAQIRAVYDEYADTEEYGYLPWDAVYSERWKNKGVSLDSAIQTVRDAMQTTKEDLATIRSTVDAEDVPYILDYYKGNQSIRECLRKAGEVKARREAEVQRRAAQELARQKAEEQRRAAAVERERAKPKQTANYSPAVTTEPNDDEVLSITFRATGTRAQFDQLRVFMQSIGMGLYRA